MDPKDIRNLQEAYIGVYDDDIREKLEFETWVNNLLEEGYDLSDYTWDELYVSYFNEAQYTPPQQIQQPAAEVRKAPNKNTQNPAVPVLTGLALAKLGNEIGKTSLRRKKKGEEEPDVKGVFEEWVTGLLDEGYDLSDYNWDEMYEIYNEARDPGVKEYQGGKKYSLETRVRKSNAVKPAGKKPEGETGGVGQVKPDGKDPLDTNKSDYEQFSLGLAPKTKKFGRPFGRKYDPAAIKNDAITSQMAKPKPEAPRRGVIKASYEPDIYDVILEYLMNEGYADTQESAEIIMVNMSEDWRESIVEEVLDEGYVDYKKGKLPSGRTPQQAAQGRSEVLNTRERNRPLGKLDGNYSRQESQNRRTKEMDKLTASNPVSRAVRRGLGDMLPGGQPSTNRHSNAMDRRNRVADLASAEKKSRSRYQHEVDPNY